MAKKIEQVISPATEQKIEDFAEDLGRLLGQAQNKAHGWLGQRKQIVEHLEGIRDTANGLLEQLGHQARQAAKSGRRGYRETAADDAPEVVKAVKRKVRKMSAAARKAISDAQKKRWAAYHKAQS
jgi:hypothetical protein